MKHVLSLLILAVFIPFLSFSQGSWGGGDPANNKIDASEIKAPKITWVKDFYDFGNVPQGIPVQVTFEFTNTGNAPLIISKVEPACNCTGAEWPKTPVMPGQKGKIKVTFDAKSGGKFTKSAVVTSNAKPTEKTLTFIGVVIKK